MKSTQHSLAIISLSMALFSGCATSRMEAQSWEYKVVLHNGANTVEPLLNELGNQGWTLVTVDNGQYTFKRLKK